MTGAPMTLCARSLYACHCRLPYGHDGPHECDPERCGGAWMYSPNGELLIVAFPWLAVLL